MRRIATTVAATTIALASLTAVAPAALAGDSASGSPDLSGRWNSAILRMDGVGWSIRVTPSGDADSYDAVLRFHYQDGRTGMRTKATLTVAGTQATLRIVGGRTVAGSLGQDGSLFLPRCYEVLKFSTKANADETCLFQDLPRES
jgi:hypothetical protein